MILFSQAATEISHSEFVRRTQLSYIRNGLRTLKPRLVSFLHPRQTESALRKSPERIVTDLILQPCNRTSLPLVHKLPRSETQRNQCRFGREVDNMDARHSSTHLRRKRN